MIMDPSGLGTAYDDTKPYEPIVTGTTPTNDTTPTWSWTSGGGGNGTYRYKLDSSDLSTGATETTDTSYTPTNTLSEGTHTLYVQECNDAGNWSSSGSKAIVISSGGSSSGGGGGGGSGGGGSGGAGIFGEINIRDVIGYHLDGVKNGIQIYMPVTNGFRALKGAQTHIEGLAPVAANLIRGGFESLERIAEADKGGLLYRIGTYAFPVLGKIAEYYLDVVDSQELMTDAYSDTMIGVDEFNKLHQQGFAISPHIVKEADE